MERNGWTFDIEYSSSDWTWATDFGLKCGNETFYGYNNNNTVGEVSATFLGSGKATLGFGNCYKTGQVEVQLNDYQVAHVQDYNPDVTITFYYKQGDVLQIKEGFAIIKMNYLKLEC